MLFDLLSVVDNTLK